MARKTRNLWLIAGLILGILVAGAYAGYRYALTRVKVEIEKALGPDSEVKSIDVGLAGIQIIGIRVRPPLDGKDRNWPGGDQLRAERIVIVPSMIDLLTGNLRLHTIRVDGAYLALVRTREGKIRVLPSLLENKAAAPAPAKDAQPAKSDGPTLRIGRIELADATVEFFDAQVRQPAHKLRLEQINAALGRLQLPDLKGESTVDVVGIVKGIRQDGKLSITGTAELASRESGITTMLRGVDLAAFQPYLVKAADTGVKRGTLDFDLKSSVRKGKLRAPGQITLSNLELASSSGSFMGVPAKAATALMKGGDGRITLKFVLDGDINDPKFSLNEHMTTRLATSLGEMAGISVEGLAKGVGQVGSGAAKGLGDSLGKLLKK